MTIQPPAVPLDVDNDAIDEAYADFVLRDLAQANEAQDLLYYGATDVCAMAPALNAEARAYPEHTLLRCRGCKRRIHLRLLAQCFECGALVCATCNPTCPHTTEVPA